MWVLVERTCERGLDRCFRFEGVGLMGSVLGECWGLYVCKGL